MPNLNMMSLSVKKYHKIDKFIDFEMTKEQVDEFLSAYAATCRDYNEFWDVCKLIFTL